MSDDLTAPSYADLPTPTLMRAARGAYAGAIRARLHAAGIMDLPRNGAIVLAGIENADGPRPDLPAELGVTKQAISQVIDILVTRGYLERDTDPGDRRRIALDLTPRGHEVIDLVIEACDDVDEQLSERLTDEQVAAMRAGLAALAQIKVVSRAAGTGRRRERQLRRFAPIFTVASVAAALEHYAGLGFDVSPYEDGDDYGFAWRDGVGLHVQAGHEHGPDEAHDHDHGHGPGSAYLYVSDADALYEQWSQPGLGGSTRAPEDTDYDMREGAHVDPDGNLIRFGSALAEEAPPEEE
jgi:DNA-binding MarR family transcriptional regulator